MDRRRFLVSSALVPATAIAGPINFTDAPTVADLAFDLKLISWSSNEALSYAEKMTIDRKLDAMSNRVESLRVAKKAYQEELGCEGALLRGNLLLEARRTSALDESTCNKLLQIAC